MPGMVNKSVQSKTSRKLHGNAVSEISVLIVGTTLAAAPPTAITPAASRITIMTTRMAKMTAGSIVSTLHLQAREPNRPARSYSPASL